MPGNRVFFSLAMFFDLNSSFANNIPASPPASPEEQTTHMCTFSSNSFCFSCLLFFLSSSSFVSSGLSHACTTASICSTKPISKSLSASSRTKNSTACVEIFFCLKSDANRNGVEMRMSTLSKSFAAFALESCVTLNPSLNRVQILVDCVANSFVGANKIALTPPSFLFPSRINIGNKKASVFPLPVGATANVSTSLSIIGIACR
mmetsp:Transcript_7301/g.22755  ORF Transcript_7301/g.22755 Transcript_7301/m.22755 type:complete len:205 (+) Transcript_7301:1929-2543(+)